MNANGLLPVADAQRRIVDTLSPLPAEQISLSQGLGRVLAEDLVSRRSQPPIACRRVQRITASANTSPVMYMNMTVIGAALRFHLTDKINVSGFVLGSSRLASGRPYCLVMPD